MTTGILSLTLFVALSLTSTCLEAASVPKSGTDQYLTRHHDQSHPVPSFNEALKVIKSKHRFEVRAKKPLHKEDYPLSNDIVPDLQVGCGDGLLVESTTVKPIIPKHKRVFPKKENRRKREINDRKSRSYFAYTVETPTSYSGYTVWRPQIYRVQRPYFIPILASKGRFPIYFPPQPVPVNPGFPQNNPPLAQNKPPNREYLPTQATEPPKIEDRFIWDERPIGTTTTRRPSRPNTSTFPPLIHNPDPNQRPRTTTARPRTTTTTAITTTAATPPPPANFVPESSQSGDRGSSQPKPNRCAWAIINCCSAGSQVVSESCFARLGCPGPFWGASPCEGDFAREAIEYALNYYQ